MSQSSGEAKTPTMEESDAVMAIPAPLMHRHAEGDQGGALGARRRRTQKARLATLEAEINELRAWKAQMAQEHPNLPMNTATQPGVSLGAGQQRIQTRHANVMGGEEPVPARSQLELGDLRHSLQARRGGQRPGGDKAPRTGGQAPSGTSSKPASRHTAKEKGKGAQTVHARVETAAQEEESVADSHVNQEEIRRMQRQIHMLERKLSEKEGGGSNQGGRSTLFSRDIMREDYPPKFKMPLLDVYHGTTDPRERFDRYQTLMEIQGASSVVMCKAFSLTLSGTAKDWYWNLPVGSISNFEELAVAFVDNFKS